jgi:predicted nucleic acid-binding protein
MIVLDTNVISEIVKPSPTKAVLTWLAAQSRSTVFITAITQAEILFGVERLPEGKRRTRLYNDIEDLLAREFAGRILAFDDESAPVFARISGNRASMGRPISQFDAMIAAIARCHGAKVATRNIKDLENCGVPLINPWAD